MAGQETHVYYLYAVAYRAAPRKLPVTAQGFCTTSALQSSTQPSFGFFHPHKRFWVYRRLYVRNAEHTKAAKAKLTTTLITTTTTTTTTPETATCSAPAAEVEPA